MNPISGCASFPIPVPAEGARLRSFLIYDIPNQPCMSAAVHERGIMVYQATLSPFKNHLGQLRQVAPVENEPKRAVDLE